MGVSSNGGTPKTRQNDHFFLQKNPWLLGTSTVGNLHIHFL